MKPNFCQVNNLVPEVLILKGLKCHQNCAKWGVDSKGVAGRRRGSGEWADRRTAGGRRMVRGHRESCRINKPIIAYWLSMSRITCKWFGCWGIALRGSG